MKTVQKMLIIPMIIAALTVFGMEATALSERNPSPVATLGASPGALPGFAPYDGAQLID
jgi:hypothetical protein